jgi:hypothetical protein
MRAIGTRIRVDIGANDIAVVLVRPVIEPSLCKGNCQSRLWVTSSGLIMSRLGQVSLTKPTYRRIVLRCCSVPRSPRQITSIGSHCGRTLWAIPLRAHGILQAGRSRPRYASGATGIGKLENGSRPKAISEVERLRRSLPEPDPENRAAISIRSARPPIIRRVLWGRATRKADAEAQCATPLKPD